MKEKYLILDPSLFTSVYRLKDALKVLNTLRRKIIRSSIEEYAEHVSLKIVLPSNLIDDFEALRAGKEPESLYEIYRAWLPFYPRDHIRAIVDHQKTDREYLENLDILFKEYLPIAAREYVENIEQIGEQSIRRERVKQKLGRIVGRIAFELIAVSHKFGAWIVGFGRRVYTLLSRVGVKIYESKSSLKKLVKRHSNVRRTLRIAGYVIALDAAKILMASLGLPEIPLSRDIGLGLILVANG